jgi:hypothetical protein
MHQQGLQLIIRQKLRDGTLPYNSIPRVWGGPGLGKLCDACGGIITKDEWVIDGIALTEAPVAHGVLPPLGPRAVRRGRRASHPGHRACPGSWCRHKTEPLASRVGLDA